MELIRDFCFHGRMLILLTQSYLKREICENIFLAILIDFLRITTKGCESEVSLLRKCIIGECQSLAWQFLEFSNSLVNS